MKGCVSIVIILLFIGGGMNAWEHGNTITSLVLYAIAAIIGLAVFVAKDSIPGEYKREVLRALEIINESVRIIEKSKNWETKKSRIGVIIQMYERLIERFGKYAEADDYRKMLALAQEEQKDIHLNAVKVQVQDCLKKAQNASSVPVKVNACDKALNIIDQAEGDHFVPSEMRSELRDVVKLARAQFTVEADLDKAAKFEFKGQTDKAIDAYKEALWKFLNTDIDESKQAEGIETLKVTIERLQAKIGKLDADAPPKKPKTLN